MAERRFRRALVAGGQAMPAEGGAPRVDRFAPPPAARHRGSLGAARRMVARSTDGGRAVPLEYLPQSVPLSELTRPSRDALAVMLPGSVDDRRA